MRHLQPHPRGHSRRRSEVLIMTIENVSRRTFLEALGLGGTGLVLGLTMAPRLRAAAVSQRHVFPERVSLDRSIRTGDDCLAPDRDGSGHPHEHDDGRRRRARGGLGADSCGAGRRRQEVRQPGYGWIAQHPRLPAAASGGRGERAHDARTGGRGQLGRGCQRSPRAQSRGRPRNRDARSVTAHWHRQPPRFLCRPPHR